MMIIDIFIVQINITWLLKVGKLAKITSMLPANLYTWSEMLLVFL